MSRYIDADALMERFAEMQKVKPDKDGREYACNFRNIGGEPSVEWFTVEDAVENAPTVDAVPVVRCKDCIEYRDSVGACHYFNYDPTDEMDFCSHGIRADGERRTDEQQT